MSKLTRTIAIFGIMLGTAYLADEYNFNTKFFNYVHRKNQVAKGFPEDYYNYELKPKINNNDEICFYLGNKKTHKYIPVNSDGTAGDISIKVKKEYNSFKEKLKDFFKKEMNDDGIY